MEGGHPGKGTLFERPASRSFVRSFDAKDAFPPFRRFLRSLLVASGLCNGDDVLSPMGVCLHNSVPQRGKEGAVVSQPASINVASMVPAVTEEFDTVQYFRDKFDVPRSQLPARKGEDRTEPLGPSILVEQGKQEEEAENRQAKHFPHGGKTATMRAEGVGFLGEGRSVAKGALMEKDSPPVSWGSPLSVCPSVRPSDLLALPRPSTTSFPSIPSRPRPPFQTQSFARSDRLLLRRALSFQEREREKRLPFPVFRFLPRRASGAPLGTLGIRRHPPFACRKCV